MAGSIDRWQSGQIDACEARVVSFGFGSAVEGATWILSIALGEAIVVANRVGTLAVVRSLGRSRCGGMEEEAEARQRADGGRSPAALHRARRWPPF